jgi:NAD(P)-dependent dehydrogenase (short-subunit alcohol dehydrogenase family)
MIVRNLALDLGGRGVSVVALAPGHVRTEMGGPIPGRNLLVSDQTIVYTIRLSQETR